MVGRLYISRVFFTDLSEFKIRLVLIMREFLKEDVLYLPLTTNLDAQGVRLSTNDLEEGILQKLSMVLVPKLNVAHKNLLIRHVGTLKAASFERVKREVCLSLGCS
jgi:mRNA-degrading endonuclease toxin of MazEF toxin-antitoxin module